jgi:ATP-dependent Clp protease protease subunit
VQLREITYEIMVKHTGQPKDRIERDMDRNLFMSAQDAKAYGIIDSIFEGGLRT